MSGSESDRAYDTLFVVGCPRSGTTWLQVLMSHHPAVSTVNETHLFSHFLGPMLESWDALEASSRDIGLASLFSRPEFVERLRGLAREATDRIADDDTRLVVDKTPDHAWWGEEILDVFPGAMVVHLVRDPRDVAASLVAASRDWGSDWAPDNAYDAAWRWHGHVDAGRSIRDLTDAYRELSYEALFADPAGELAGLLRWAGLDAPDDVVREAVRETRLSRMKEGRTEAPWDLEDEPEGFVRKGGSGNWKDELSRSEVRIVEHVAGDLMEELGYEPSARGRLPPAALVPYWLRDRLLERLS